MAWEYLQSGVINSTGTKFQFHETHDNGGLSLRARAAKLHNSNLAPDQRGYVVRRGMEKRQYPETELGFISWFELSCLTVRKGLGVSPGNYFSES